MGRHYPDTSDINVYFINVYWILPVQKRKKERINKEKRPLTRLISVFNPGLDNRALIVPGQKTLERRRRTPGGVKLLAMNSKIHFLFLVTVTYFLLSCNGQTTSNSQNKTEKNGVVGGPFENGEFMYIDMPEHIKSIDTSAGWSQKGQKLLVTGTIYKLDGKTPAPDVILYYYHTDINGVYASKQGLDPRVVRHGYIRGWVKSDENGKYAIYTVRPAPYPNTNFEAHIHPAIKEPNIDKEYYIDEFVFDDDKLLTREKRKRLENRGGSGILSLFNKDDLQIAEHNIVLGLNIPNYPETIKAEN